MSVKKLIHLKHSVHHINSAELDEQYGEIT